MGRSSLIKAPALPSTPLDAGNCPFHPARKPASVNESVRSLRKRKLIFPFLENIVAVCVTAQYIVVLTHQTSSLCFSQRRRMSGLFAQFLEKPEEFGPFRSPVRLTCPCFSQVIERTSKKSPAFAENRREGTGRTPCLTRNTVKPQTARAQEFAPLLAATRRGDREARDQVLHRSYDGLADLAGKMLNRFPGLRARMEASHVLHGALIRLLSALPKLQVSSRESLFGLAAAEIRRELLDLTRLRRNRREEASRHADLPEPEVAELPDNLEARSNLQEEIAKLPVQERQVVVLRVYSGWKEQDIGELFHVTTRTVRSRWHSAFQHLRQRIHDRG